MNARSITGRTVSVNDKEYLYFGGTSYLGLPYNGTFQTFFTEGMQRYGSSLGSSPLSQPGLTVYTDLEHLLAKKYGFKQACLFQSGFAAGQAALAILQQQNYQLVYSQMAHPAIVSNQAIQQSLGPKAWLSDYIEPVNLTKITDLEPPKSAALEVIDASHALGLLDGELQQYCANKKVIVTASLNKALGTAAGIVLYNDPNLPFKELVNYSTASPPSPAACFALLKSFQTGLIGQQQEKLLQLLTSFSPKEKRYKYSSNFPVLITKDASESFFQKLKKSNILVWRNAYPKGSGNVLNRVVTNAEHTEADIRRLWESW